MAQKEKEEDERRKGFHIKEVEENGPFFSSSSFSDLRLSLPSLFQKGPPEDCFLPLQNSPFSPFLPFFSLSSVVRLRYISLPPPSPPMYFFPLMPLFPLYDL